MWTVFRIPYSSFSSSQQVIIEVASSLVPNVIMLEDVRMGRYKIGVSGRVNTVFPYCQTTICWDHTVFLRVAHVFCSDILFMI